MHSQEVTRKSVRSLFPRSFHNAVTLVGLSIAVVALGLIAFLFVLELFARHSNPYLGLITFLVLPVFVLIGGILAVVGVVREHRSLRAGKQPSDVLLSRIDLSDPKQRKAFTLFAVVGMLLLGTSAFMSYQAYEYTESVNFCGLLCHKVMAPEYVAYRSSPHARVSCVQCHIGPGTTWFVRSKLSGLYQVYATVTNTYPQPIPTPIHNLRPARETCEQCHWPRYFAGEKLQARTYFMPDQHNTRHRLDLLMKIGGGNTDQGASYGIHWHMNITNEVTYAVLDRERMLIPWVQVKTADGSTTVYRSTEIAASEAQIRTAEKRLMDCIDCHNRPAHIFNHPNRLVNLAMAENRISPALPQVRDIAERALTKSYGSGPEAKDAIRRSIEEFYRAGHPEIWSAKKADIEKTTKQVQQMYSRNFFPEMNVDWKAFQDNLGHMYYVGCFRCHDGKHVSDDGKVLSKDCQTCHTILAQQHGDSELRASLDGVEFRHPANVGEAWKETNCSDCHGEK